MANENLGASFSIDTTDLKAGLAQANRLIKESESEFKAAAAGMDDWAASEDGLNAKIKSLNSITEVQRQKVDALQSEYDRLIAEGLDPASKQATELRTKINNETAALNKNEAELKKQTQALEELENQTEETGDATDDAGEKFQGLKAAGGVAAGAIAAVGAACVAAVGAFFGLAESTREARENMAKLETGFTTAGHSAEDATKTYTELYGILGDDGQATEAAAHLAQLTDNQEDLSKWTNIATGVYATFGDSLPIEGLTEAANETAKTGALTGGLADALNWAGVNEEEFQAKLDACSTEQERQALITSTLNGLYSEAADAYRENNAEVIAAQEAQANLNNALNELGAIAEPIMTTLKTLAADLLTTITPFVSLIGEGLAGALNGTAGAADTLAEGLSGIITTALDKIIEMIPFIIDTIVAVIPQILTALISQLPTILQTVIDIVIQVINGLSEMLPTIITAIMRVIPLLINALIAAIPQILQAAIQLLMSIVDALPVIIHELIYALPSIIDTIITALIDSIPILIDAAIKLLMSIVNAIPTIIDALIVNLPRIIDTIVSGIVKAVPQLVQGAVKLFEGIIAAIPKIIPQLIRALPQIITSIIGGLIKGIPQLIKAGADLLAGLFKGLLNPKAIAKAVKGLFDGIVGGIKSLFGIHSPSKVMADEVGKNLALGIGEGFANNIGAVNDDIASAMNFENGKLNVNAGRSGGIGGNVTVYQTNNYAQAHSRYELYKTKQQTAAAVRLAIAGV